MHKRIKMTAPLKRVWFLALIAGAYSSLALLKSQQRLAFIPDIPISLDAALSFAMALLISFRVNRSYERWWEARSLWGKLVNTSRNLAIKIQRMRRPSAAESQDVRDLIVAFCIGLKDHLRETSDISKLPGFQNAKEKPGHIPSYVVSKIYDLFQQWRSGDEPMSDTQLLILDSEVRMFLEVCGGCEKIKSTPVSISWKVFTTQCIAIYLVVLPWGFVDDFGVWTIPFTVVVAYLVIAAEVIARYVEEPFGPHEDHLDLNSITEVISRSVSEELLEAN